MFNFSREIRKFFPGSKNGLIPGSREIPGKKILAEIDAFFKHFPNILQYQVIGELPKRSVAKVCLKNMAN